MGTPLQQCDWIFWFPFWGQVFKTAPGGPQYSWLPHCGELTAIGSVRCCVLRFAWILSSTGAAYERAWDTGIDRPSHVTLYGTFKPLFSHADREKQGLWPGLPDACDPRFPGHVTRISATRFQVFGNQGQSFRIIFGAGFWWPLRFDYESKGGPKTGTLF